MRIAILGAGATGTFYGGCLAQAGQDVAFIARGAQLEAFRTTGLSVESVDFGQFTVPKVKATNDPSTVGPADLVLVCVKTYDLDSAIHALPPLLGPETCVVPLLNGVEAASLIASKIGAGRVLGGLARIEATLVRPGVVAHTSQGVHLVSLGELDGAPSPRAKRLVDALKPGGFNVQLSPDITKESWEKYVMMCGFSSMCALTRLPKGPLFEHEGTRDLIRSIMAEVRDVAKVKGIRVSDRVVEEQMGFLQKRGGGFTSSMARDLERGRRIEIEAFNGALVRFGRETGVPVPANEFVYACLKPFEGGAPKAASVPLDAVAGTSPSSTTRR